MQVLIRDDDVCYFTKPEELESIYHDYWGKIKIILSVVPFQEGGPHVTVPQKYQGGGTYKISSNKKLVSYIRDHLKSGDVEIALHGITHRDSQRGSEFSSCTSLIEETRMAKQYLEETFKTKVSFFSPPHNALDRDGLKSVLANSMDILNVPRFLTCRNFWETDNWQPFIEIIIANLTSGLMPRKYLRFRNHRELFCWSLTPTSDINEVKRAYRLASEENGVFCLSTHYWELLKDLRLKKSMDRLLLNK